MIIFPGLLKSHRSRVDGTLDIVFETNEISPSQMADIHSQRGTFGYIAFKEEPFKTKEKEIIENLETDYDDGKKTDSQRLRAVLYLLWKKEPEGYQDFNLYKKFKMEKIINHYKKLLDD